MRLRIPASQSKTRLGRLILEVLSEDLTSPLASNAISLIVGIEKITVVGIPMLVIGGNIIVVRVVGFQPVLLSLFGDQRDRTESETKKSRPTMTQMGFCGPPGFPRPCTCTSLVGGSFCV